MTDRRRKSSVIMPDSTTCDCGKRGYWDKKGAKVTVQRLRREGSRNPQDLQAYRCPDGTGLWHVGHKTRAFLGPNLNDPRLRFI